MNAEQINKLLDKLGSAINAKGSQAFSIYVKQEYMTGVTDIAWGVLGILLLISSVIILYKMIKKFIDIEDGSKYIDSCLTIMVISFIAFIISLLLVSLLSTGIKEMLNPSYYALQDIITSITGN